MANDIVPPGTKLVERTEDEKKEDAEFEEPDVPTQIRTTQPSKLPASCYVPAR
jgi:hypothetical protein